MTSSRTASLPSVSSSSPPSLRLLHTLSHPASSITAVLFCPNHRHALYSTADRIINLIPTVPASSSHPSSSSSSSPAVIRTYSPPHGYDITAIAISPVSSSLLFSVSSDRHCCITAVETAQTVRKMQAHEQRINSVAVHEGEAVFITGGNDGLMKVWDLRARGGRAGGSGGGREVQVMREAKDSVTGVAFLYDRPHVICSCSADGCLRLYDARRGELAVQRAASALSAVFPSRQGGAVLLSSLSSRLLLFDTSPPATASPLLRSFSSPLYCSLRYSLRCALLREGTQVVSGSESSNALLVWDVQSSKLVAQWGGDDEQQQEDSSSSSSSKQGVQAALDWDEHQALLMAGSTVGDVRLWQLSF